MAKSDIHSCGYHCQRPECVLAQRDELVTRVERMQAQIDGLMMEFCPGEMTDRQIAQWQRSQRPVFDRADRPTPTLLRDLTNPETPE